MTTGVAPCINCKWFIEPWKCKAFDIIPPDIARGLNNHREPYPNDGGIHFEPIDNRKNKNDTQTQRENNL